MGGFGFDASKVFILIFPCDLSPSVVQMLPYFLFLRYLALPNSVSLRCIFDQSLGAEKDGLDIIQHDWALSRFEQRAESVLRKLVK